MLESKFVADSRPAPRYKHWIIDGVRFTRAIFEPGMWQENAFPACRGYAEIDTSHIQPVGTLIDPAEVLAPREPGWMSSKDWYPIPEGVHRRTAITRTEVWCARPLDKVSSVWYLEEIRLVPGAALLLVPGRSLFLVAGGGTVEGTAVGPFTHLQIQGHEKSLFATALTYGFAWGSDA